MCFWEKFAIFMKENTFDNHDYELTLDSIECYLKGENYYNWDCLTLNMQEIIIGFELESGVRLVPEGAQLNYNYIGV